MAVCLHRFCLNMNVRWAFVCSELGEGTIGYSEECCYSVMYVGWCGACSCICC